MAYKIEVTIQNIEFVEGRDFSWGHVFAHYVPNDKNDPYPHITFKIPICITDSMSMEEIKSDVMKKAKSLLPDLIDEMEKH